MSSTRVNNIIVNSDPYYEVDYHRCTEEEIPPIQSYKLFGNFRIHGKYVSTFHPGGRLPNEYYCKASDAMSLRSGKKLNYVQETYFWHDAQDLLFNFSGNKEYRCLSMKKVIWFLENYYYLLWSSYDLAKLYDVGKSKIKEFIGVLERSVPGIYRRLNYDTKFVEGNEHYVVEYKEAMSARFTEGKYVFCHCHYTVINVNEKVAIEKEGRHCDEYLPKLKKLMKMYSKHHRIVIESDVFKFMNRRLNEDCRRLIFEFVSAQDILN